MQRYLLRRLARGLLILLGVSVCSFLLAELARGDFFAEARLNPQISEHTISALRAEYGLDRPIVWRYGYWLASAFRGNLGFSMSYHMPVWPLLWSRAQNTLLLTVPAMLLTWLTAVPLAVWIAATNARLNRLASWGAVSLLMTTPDLLIVLLLELIAARSGLLPLGGMISLDYSDMSAWGRLRDMARHLALPVTALVLAAAPAVVTHTASAMREALESVFIKAARANGIRRGRLLFYHALPAAANPLISLFGLSAGALLSSSLLVESAMGWPGLGRLLLEATLQRDRHVVIGIVMLSASFLVAGTLLADLLLYLADPRIRRD
jgi:peptide/nickel transport system permease protein